MAKKKQKRTVLKNKPRKYKIGDTVEVDFNGERHSAEIIDLYQPQDWPTRWVYKVRLKDGYKVPFVGIKNTEKFCNIVA
jgi:ribosomal protein L21E